MDKWKKIGWKLLFPNKIIIFFMVNVSAALLVWAFVGKTCPEAVAYFSYALSAYALTVVCARMPEVIKKFKQYLYKNKYSNKLLTDKDLRIRISLHGGLIVNVSFAIFKVVVGILYQSGWLFAMAGYNTILSIMRFVLVRRDQNDKKVASDYERRLHGLQSYKVCGWFMLLLNFAISVIVGMVVVDKQTIAYPGFMIYAIAAFTFYCITMAIINMVKYWHRQNPVFSAVKRIGMAKALVSIFTMQVAMLTQFGSGDASINKIFNIATGSCVCIIITIMAILMLIDVKKDYKEMR